MEIPQCIQPKDHLTPRSTPDMTYKKNIQTNIVFLI